MTYDATKWRHLTRLAPTSIPLQLIFRTRHIFKVLQQPFQAGISVAPLMPDRFDYGFLRSVRERQHHMMPRFNQSTGEALGQRGHHVRTQQDIRDGGLVRQGDRDMSYGRVIFVRLHEQAIDPHPPPNSALIEEPVGGLIA